MYLGVVTLSWLRKFTKSVLTKPVAVRAARVGKRTEGKPRLESGKVKREGILNLSAARAQDQKAPTSIRATRPAWGFLWVIAALASP